MDCRDCIHHDRCDTIFDGLLSNRDNKPCGQFDSRHNYFKFPCFVGSTIYFIGYGVVEELFVTKINLEFSETFMDSPLGYLGYIDARRPDGTTESIGFNVFGELAFANKKDAERTLNVRSLYND